MSEEFEIIYCSLCGTEVEVGVNFLCEECLTEEEKDGTE